MAITSRTAQNACIYWANNRCTAYLYFNQSTISCYNDGDCDLFGTCLDCSRYDGPGLKLSNLSKSDVETGALEYDQTPIDISIYNLRAKLQKCCNWDGSTLELSVDASNNVLPTVTTSTTKCIESQAADWQVPWTPGSQHTTSMPCNGAKSSCPYYTGPKFQYLTDEKMERGQPVSAAQIMELRYYSKDWKKYASPRAEYEKVFTKPDIWAWFGSFDDSLNDGSDPEPSEESLAKVTKVTLFENSQSSTDSFEDALYIGGPKIAQTGTSVLTGVPDYPTLVKDLSDTVSAFDIKWPKGSKAEPYTFRTFRIGLNKVYVIVIHNSDYPVYAVNVSKHPQNDKTDQDFIEYMLNYNPDDIKTTEIGSSILGSVFAVELEYQPELNEIKVFTNKADSTDGSMYTDTTFVQHKFFHAHLAQTSFNDNYGQAVVEPWVDRFMDFDAEVSIFQLSKNEVTVDDILWDTVAYNKTTIYETQFTETEIVSDWDNIHCDVVALNIGSTNANPVQPWTVTAGAQTAQNILGVELGVWADRSANPNLPSGSSAIVEMEVLSKSENGLYHPANVLFVKPKEGSFGFDPKYDTFKITFAYTKYNQGPVPLTGVGDLQYPSRAFTDYITTMPYEVSPKLNGAGFSVLGMTLPIYSEAGTEEVGRLGVSDFEDAMSDIENLTEQNEKRAIESFGNGGSAEDTIEAVGEVYAERETEFRETYKSKVFFDGTAVTLQNLCTKLNDAGYYEGTQEYRVTFKDDTGRPIGIKRLYLLMQSAIPSCRDVEIYYQWRTQGAYVDPRDHQSLLARDYKPMLLSGILREYTYTPRCGDHSLQYKDQTFYTKFVGDNDEITWGSTGRGTLEEMFQRTAGAAGPLWYPYKNCSMPKYARDNYESDAILCSAYVEGFGGGLRRSYWEKARGEDIYWAAKIAIQTVIGCTWSFIEGDYQTIKEPTFSGFTRIRSGHLMGPYQTDREAIRLSRHYLKRNVAVRNEWVRPSGVTSSLSLSSEGSSFLFDSDGSPKNDEKPVWVHQLDGLSVVNRTTPLAKDPFANLRMVSTGKFAVDEEYRPLRVSLSQVFRFKDLVKNEDRDESGNLVYNPEEPLYQTEEEEGSFSTGKDIYWIYKSEYSEPESESESTESESPEGDIVWAWLERQKDPERAVTTGSVGGVFVYNPSVNAFKKNFESATFMPDGVYDLVYTPPTFDGNGGVVTNPTLAFSNGPPREIDWDTGVLLGAPSSFGVDPYDESKHTSADGATFQLFGKVNNDGHGFLADDSGKHTFELDGNAYETFRGIGIRPKVVLSLLPGTKVDAIAAYSANRFDILQLSDHYSKKVFEIDFKGSKQVDSFVINYQLGPDITENKTYALPQISIDGQLPSGSWVNNIAFMVAHSPTATFRIGDQEASLSGKYKKARINVGPVPSKMHINLTDIKLYLKEPVSTTEKIRLYDQKASVSLGDAGSQFPSDLYYYYGRTFTDFGLNDVNYDETANAGPYHQDLKWQNRSVRDVVLNYFFMDPTGTVYDYPNSPISELDNVANSGGAYYIDGALELHNKTQTVITGRPVSDPINAQTTGLSWSNTVAPDESSGCSNATSEKIRDENLQECLYEEAKSLIGASPITVYTSFWHPDEEEFFVNSAGLVEMPSWTLTLRSFVAPLSRVMRHQSYGCNKRYTDEYHDGRVHEIPQWRALGHLLYLGRPLWNWTCTAIVMQKVNIHLGEEYFEKDPATYVSTRRWPPDSITNVKIEKAPFYYENPEFWQNPSTYTGGSLSTGTPLRVSQALNYSPGGVPRGWFQELAAYPETKQWPIGTGNVGGFSR